MVLLITALVFAVITGTVMSAYYVLTAESPVEQRLRTLVPDAATGARQRASAARPGLPGRMVAGVGRYGLSRGDRSLAQTLSAAGFRATNATALFLGARTLLSFGPALGVILFTVPVGQPLGSALWMACVAWAGGHVAANWWLRQRSRRRIQRVTEALPDSLDLMVVCLESGLGLNATIARVGEERAAMDDPLGQEFAQVAFELRSGRSREDSLRSLGDRNGAEDLKALAGLVIQSDRLGASMAKTLRAHADLLRTKRRQRGEEAARKLPIKVLLPLATMLLPALMIMVAGPAFLKLQDLVKVIGGG
jgi:tight adherence protein C